jgi:hypothetical protein
MGGNGPTIGRAKNSARPTYGLVEGADRADFEPGRGYGFAQGYRNSHARLAAIMRLTPTARNGSKPAGMNLKD